MSGHCWGSGNAGLEEVRRLPIGVQFRNELLAVRTSLRYLNASEDFPMYWWLHIGALLAYVGATVVALVHALPRARRQRDPQRALEHAARFLRWYDPLCIATLGIVVMTGAFSLTAYKAALREAFFPALGAALAWKLLAAFLLINVAAYSAFGLGHRLVAAAATEPPPAPDWTQRILFRLQITCAATLLLCALTSWLALRV